MKNTNNPSLFRKLSEPHESADKLNEAIEGFYQEVSAAREKYELLNVVIVISSPAMDEGEERPYQASVSFGDPLKVPLMLASALGEAERDFERTIDKLKAGRR